MTNLMTLPSQSEVFFGTCGATPDKTDDTSALSQRMQTRVAMRTHPDPWLDQALSIVTDLLALEPNWSSYGSEVVKYESVRHAVDVLFWLAHIENVEAPTVTATPDGEVGFCWDAGDWSLDAWVETAGRINYVFIDETNHDNDRDTWTDNWQDLLPLLTRW